MLRDSALRRDLDPAQFPILARKGRVQRAEAVADLLAALAGRLTALRPRRHPLAPPCGCDA